MTTTKTSKRYTKYAISFFLMIAVLVCVAYPIAYADNTAETTIANTATIGTATSLGTACEAIGEAIDEAINSASAEKEVEVITLEVIENTDEVPEKVEGIVKKAKDAIEEEQAPVLNLDDYRSMVNEEDVVVLSKLLWGEARGVPSTAEKAAVIWCVLNRVDENFNDSSIIGVSTAYMQFVGYNPYNPVDENLSNIVTDVLCRWYAEKDGFTEVGRTLPQGYCYFYGDGLHNHFRNAWRGDYVEWNWDYPSPYESDIA